MKRVSRTMQLFAGWVLAIGSPALRVAEGSAAGAGAIVELPPMMVEESVSGVPWLYVNAGGTEFLSRCSAATTRDLASAWLTKVQMIRILVPEEFLARMDVPSVFVLYGQDVRQAVSAEIQSQLQSDRANIAPSMRLSDRDMHASIAYIDETLFDASTLSISPNHVGHLLRRRVPALPAWLVQGMERTWARADFVVSPVTLAPMVWLNSHESDALAGDPTRPRAVLPATELLAIEPMRAAENQHPRRVAVRASTQELFVRWGMLSDAATREAFWRFAAQAAERPVTEELFESCFGFDFSELRDRLSDYLPEAVRKDAWIAPGRRPPLPRIEVERATPNQIARVRGEWERLAIGHVRRHLPQVVEPYIDQARRTLRRAYYAGDRDPRLLATMGLCEIDAGNEAEARRYLEPAVALGVVRPRAYYELARLRFEELRASAPDAPAFSFAQLAPVLEPLRRGLQQAPPLPELYALLGEAWAQSDVAPNTAEFAELATGARLFGRRPEVAYPLARALARHERKAEAEAILAACADYVTETELQATVAQLRRDLAEASSTPEE